ADADVPAAEELDEAHPRRAPRRGEDIGALLVGAEAGGLRRRGLDAQHLLADEEGVPAPQGRGLPGAEADPVRRDLVADVELAFPVVEVRVSGREERIVLEEERSLGAAGDVVLPGERERHAVESVALDEDELRARLLLRRAEVLRAPVGSPCRRRGRERRAAGSAESIAGLDDVAALLADPRRR